MCSYLFFWFRSLRLVLKGSEVYDLISKVRINCPLPVGNVPILVQKCNGLDSCVPHLCSTSPLQIPMSLWFFRRVQKVHSSFESHFKNNYFTPFSILFVFSSLDVLSSWLPNSRPSQCLLFFRRCWTSRPQNGDLTTKVFVFKHSILTTFLLLRIRHEKNDEKEKREGEGGGVVVVVVMVSVSNVHLP